MIHFLLPSLFFASNMSLLTCDQAYELLGDVRSEYGEVADAEVIQTVKDATESGCNWDASAD